MLKAFDVTEQATLFTKDQYAVMQYKGRSPRRKMYSLTVSQAGYVSHYLLSLMPHACLEKP